MNDALRALLVLLALILAGYFIWDPEVKPFVETAITISSSPTARINPPASPQATASPSATRAPRTICSARSEITLLLVGTDYRRDDYFAGLADVIRIVQVDFSVPSVNVIALPRDLLIDLPEEQFDVEGPFKLAQAYFFGTPSGDHFSGEDGAAGALSAAIQHNFGIAPNNYIVLDFAAFRQFINAIGGIEVDLPTSVIDGKFSFPQGTQLLDGREALIVARARKQYDEYFRINSQTIIMQAIFNRLKEPEILFQLPSLMNEFRDAVLMDLSSVDIFSAFCLLSNLSRDELHFYAPEEELLAAEREYLPTLGNRSFVLKWDERFLDWIEASSVSD